MRADRDDRALDRVEVAQQPHLDLLARVVALERGRHDEQPVGAHERCQHARAARQRRRDQPAADASDPHPHPVVAAERGRQPAREPRPRARARNGRGSLQRGEQRQREQLERQGGRDGVAGRAEHRRAVDDAEHHRVSRLDGDAVHEQRARPLHDGRRVVVAPGARAGDDDHEVGRGRSLPHRGRDPVGVVGEDRRCLDLAAGFLRLRGEHQRVRVDELTRRRRRAADRPDLVAGRDHEHARRAADRQRGVAGGRGRGEVDGPQPVPLGQQQLGRADVLADRAHVLPRGDRRAHLGNAALPVQLLAHHDRVEALRQRVAGVDDGEPLHLHRRRLGRPEGVRRAHRDPVHCSRVVGGRGAQRPDGRRGHAAERVGERGLDRLDPAPLQRAQPGCQRLLGGDVADEHE